MKFGSVELAQHDNIYKVIDDVKALGRGQLEEIIASGGLEVLAEAPENLVLFTAMSFVQEAWYVAAVAAQTDEAGLKILEASKAHCSKGHEARIAKYANTVAKLQRSAVPKAPKPAKAVDAVKTLNRAVRQPVVVRAGTKVAERRYSVGPAKNGEFTGFRKAIYAALVAAGSEARMTISEVISAVVAAGTTFGGKDGGLNQTQYQLKELVKSLHASQYTAQDPEPTPLEAELGTTEITEASA